MCRWKAGLLKAACAAATGFCISGGAAFGDVAIWLGTCSTENWYACCEFGGEAHNNWHAIGFSGSCPEATYGAYPDEFDDVSLNGYSVMLEPDWAVLINSLDSTNVFTMKGLQFSVRSSASISGTMNWDVGSLTGWGGVVAPWQIGPSAPPYASALLEIRGSGGKGLASAEINLNPLSTGLLTGDGTVMLNVTSAINVLPGATFEAQSETYFLANPFDGPGKFNNAGLFRRTTSSGFLEFQVPFHNTGAVSVESGVLRLKQGSASGEFDVAAGAMLEFGNVIDYSGSGEFALLDGAEIGGAGIARLFNGLILSVPAGATASVRELHFALDGPLNAYVRGLGTLEISELLDWSGGVMENAGKVLIKPSASAALGGADSKLLGDGRVLENHGTLTLGGSGDLYVGGGALLDNAAGALFDIQTDADVSVSCCAGPGSISNAGSMRKSAGSGETRCDVPVTNTGTLKALSGIMKFTAGYVQTAGLTSLNGGTIAPSPWMWIDIQGGALEGVGNVGGRVRNAGEVRPGLSPGILTILTGDWTAQYEQTAVGVLSIEIGGTTPGTGHDQLVVGDLATLGGTLKATLIGGYSPLSGEFFDVLLYGSRYGEFAALEMPAGFSAEYLPDRVRLSYHPPCVGDCTGDGKVDQSDLGVMLSCYGVGACCDLDGDDDTDQADLGILLAAYGTSCP